MFKTCVFIKICQYANGSSVELLRLMKRHKITTQHIQGWSGLHNIGRALHVLDGMFPCPVRHCFNLVCD